MIFRFIRLIILPLLVAGCTESVVEGENPRILLMGDSLLAIHGASGKAVSDAMESILGEPVVDRSVSGARYFYRLPISGRAGLNIKRQYVDGNWDWIILNGGGNDLLFGCGCALCDWQMDRLISANGRKGTIPGYVSKLRATGANVIYVGYLRTPGVTSPVEGCVDDGDELEGRIARLAALDRGVYFVSLADLVPNGDRSYHAIDLIHPSVKASKRIAERIVKVIRP